MGRCARKMMASVDETDRAILSALRENSRQAFVELAKIVGVSERTIRTRVRRLKRWNHSWLHNSRNGNRINGIIRMKVGPGLKSDLLPENSPTGRVSNLSTKSVVKRIWLQWFTSMTLWAYVNCWIVWADGAGRNCQHHDRIGSGTVLIICATNSDSTLCRL